MVETISKEELQQKIGRENVVVLDALSRDSFDTLHIAGSISLPLEELKQGEWEKLDKTKEYVTYCADSNCQASKNAATFLKEKGFNAKAYEGGIKEWSQSGLPVEGTALKFFKIKSK